MKNVLLLLAVFALTTLNFSCKKDKGDDEEDGITVVRTLEVSHTPLNGVYGEKYTFKLQFDQIGNIKEYGIVYKPWIRDHQDKKPVLDGDGSFKLPFGSSPTNTGTIETKDISLRYADFNDANYRAYAVTVSGEVIYGDILYISFA